VASLILAETIKDAHSLPGTRLPMYFRSFRTQCLVQEHRCTFRPIVDALDLGATQETLSAGVTFENIPPGCQDAYALVVNLGGEFHSVDEVVVEHVSTGIGETVVRLTWTRVECEDGEPALLDVFLIMPLTPEIVCSNCVRLTFSVRHRSYTARITGMDDAIRDCVVDLTTRSP